MNTTDPSVNSTETTTPATTNTDTMNMNNSNSNNTDNMNNMNSTTTNSTNTMNMNDTSMNSNLINPNNIPGQTDYAALPVLETYVPADIVAQVKQKYPNQVIYDITAVKAPVDSSMMVTDSMSMNQNGMNQNNTTMNQTTTTNQDSTSMNATANMNVNNSNNGMAMDSTAKMPEKFNYVVRVINGGQLTTETLSSDGTTLNPVSATKNDVTQ